VNPPRSSALSAATRLLLGILVVLVAMIFFGASRLLAGSQRHAYDPHATPPPTYRLTAGRQYQLSTIGGVRQLTSSGVVATGSNLSCAATADSGQNDPLMIDEVRSDDRDLHVIATFTAQSSGDFHVHCDRIAAVFVDDADQPVRDWSGIGVPVAAILALLGVSMAISGAYELAAGRRTGSPDTDWPDTDSRDVDVPGTDAAGAHPPLRRSDPASVEVPERPVDQP
jgi:hypothetical protein